MIKQVFRLTRMEILWSIIIIMLGVNMYWTSILITPILHISETQNEVLDAGINQQQEIIANQNNNTALLVELFERQNKLLANQIMLVSELANATASIRQANADITGHVRDIVNQSAQVTAMVQQFRDTFARGLYTNQTIQGNEILNNVTNIGDEIRVLRSEIVELLQLALNNTEPGARESTTPIPNFILLPAAMASDDEDDLVGEILEDEGVERNPPEVETNPEFVNTTEPANTSTGQISSFSEGPTVVVPP